MTHYKYKLLSCLVAVGFAFSACEKQLDLDPYASVEESKAFQTSADVEAALVGAYSRVGDDNVLGGDMGVYSELLGNDEQIGWSGTYQGLTQMYNKAIPVNNDFVEDTWKEAYEAINVCNNVLAAIDKVSEGKRDNVEGQAKFLRGIVYFEMVRLYAKAWNDGNPAENDGVPLVLTPTREVSEELKVNRSKVSEVYTQIISDLTDAESKMWDKIDNGFYANRTAAAALLARVYLQKGDYANAADAANRAIESNENSLMETYAEAFPVNYDNTNALVANTDEDIFAMQVTLNTGYNDFNTFFSLFGRGDIYINPEYYENYEAADDRLSVFALNNYEYTSKFDMVYGNVHIIRLAEMYLVRAEANFRAGTAVGAKPLDDINTIRVRALLEPLTGAQLNLDAILLERYHELSFEGHRLHDVKRLEGSVGSFPWNSPKLVLPIPEREIKINPGLTQNEGY
ncbi:RagB/SusD family nutrient uptake outer membrane protein [Flavihumibacter petaseus]|nr:RagB/SusD family nutrient uptake outer membrane protein [Flavihumibacter petaseus]